MILEIKMETLPSTAEQREFYSQMLTLVTDMKELKLEHLETQRNLYFIQL